MKHSNILILTTLIATIIITSINSCVTIDYVNKCTFSFNNKTPLNVNVELKLETKFYHYCDHTNDSIIIIQAPSDSCTLILEAISMPPHTWSKDINNYFTELTITTENGDTIIHEKPTTNKNWSYIDSNHDFPNKDWTYTFNIVLP